MKLRHRTIFALSNSFFSCNWKLGTKNIYWSTGIKMYCLWPSSHDMVAIATRSYCTYCM